MADVQERPATLEGGISTIAGRVLTGWVRGAAESLKVEFLCDGEFVGGAVAAPEAKEGSDRLSFELLLPANVFDGLVHNIAACSGGAGILLRNDTFVLTLEGQAKPAPPPLVTGHLDIVSDRLGIVGWARYPDQPDERVEVELLVDGKLAGMVVANKKRPDLEKVGFGDGTFGFAMPLPYYVMNLPRDVIITARDRRSGYVLPEPIAFRQKAIADAMLKIDELENEVRLLQGTISALERRGSQDELTALDLFRTVGNFFRELAQGGSPAKLRTLNAAVADVTSDLPTIALPVEPVPDLSLYVQAAGTAAQMHAVMASVLAQVGQAKVEVFLMDCGDCPDAPLLPLVVQNLRYVRLPGVTVAARCNDAMRLAAGRVLIFLGAGTVPQCDWAILAPLFDEQPRLGALAARVAEPNGKISGGAEVRDGFVQRKMRSNESRGPVEAVAGTAFAVRRTLWEQLGGLDEGFALLGSALAEFCLRVHGTGNIVSYEPSFAMLSDAADQSVDLAGEASDAAHLRELGRSFKQAAE